MSDRMLSFEARPDIPSLELVLVWRSVCIWFGNFCTCVVSLKTKLSQKHTFVCASPRPNAVSLNHLVSYALANHHHRWRWRSGTASVEPWRLKTIARTYVFCFLSVRAFACLTSISRVCNWQTNRHTKLIKRKKETKTTSFKTKKREKNQKQLNYFVLVSCCRICFPPYFHPVNGGSLRIFHSVQFHISYGRVVCAVMMSFAARFENFRTDLNLRVPCEWSTPIVLCAMR